MSEPVLSFSHIRRSFSVRQGLFGKADLFAVSDVSLAIGHQETLGLVGESGCGKSTLARIAVGLLPPSGGEVRFNGERLEAPSVKLQMVFQDPFSSLNPRMRVGTAVAEPLRAAGVAPEVCIQQAHEMLVRVGLRPEHAGRYPHEFSGGQRQRIAIARALISRPELVVCDEAVSALDASVQAQVLNLLRDVQDEFGLSYLFISHALSVVGSMSDRVAVMYLGRIVELADRESVFRRPRHPYTQALLAAAPNRDPNLRGQVAFLPGEMPSPFQPPSGCPFHPRCPRVMPVCLKTLPELTERQPGHWARCFLES